jgi:hypothetical protein
VGVLLRFVVAAFTIVTLALVAAVGVSAGSRGFGTSHGSTVVSGQLHHFFANSKEKEAGNGDNCAPKDKKRHHKATPPHECDDEDGNGD